MPKRIAAYGEEMRQLMPGLYSGDEVRAERNANGFWRFQMKARQLGQFAYWLEYSPSGHWCAIGGWRTLKEGLWVASRLRSGTHFWDEGVQTCRLYGEEIYEALRHE